MALVGAGRMAQTHAATAVNIAQVDVVAVCDALFERAEDLGERIGARVAPSLDDLLGAGDVDALLITTPTPTHADIICSGAAAGKAMFVEKPLADTLAAADRAVDAVDAAGVACQVGFQRRYDPAYELAKRRIEAGELGRIEGFRGVGEIPSPQPWSSC